MVKNAGEYICTLYYLLHISVNLKLLQKIKSIIYFKKKKRQSNYSIHIRKENKKLLVCRQDYILEITKESMEKNTINLVFKYIYQIKIQKVSEALKLKSKKQLEHIMGKNPLTTAIK